MNTSYSMNTRKLNTDVYNNVYKHVSRINPAQVPTISLKTRLRVDDERSKNAVEIEFLMRSEMSKSSLLMRFINRDIAKIYKIKRKLYHSD